MASAMPPTCVTFKNEHHESITKLNRFRKGNKFCDLNVLINGKVFFCHSSVLAANSHYFERRLTTTLLTNGIYKLDITKTGCNHKVFELLLDFIYTGTVEVPVEIIDAFLRESEIFEIDCLRPVIDDTLSPEAFITFDNIVSLVLTCDRLNINSSKEKCIAFICEHFVEVISKKLFLKLTDNILKEVLSRDELHVDHEDDLIDVVLQWTDHWPSKRCIMMVDVLKSLRWGRISFVKVNAKLLKHRMIQNNPEALNFIAKLSEYFSSGGKSCPNFNVNDKPRLKLKTKIVIVGGILKHGISDVLTYDIEEKSWERLPNLPKPLWCIGCIVIDNILFVVGGMGANNQPVKLVFSFDPVENVWREKASMGTPRVWHGLVAIGSKIIAIGGITERIETDKGANEINTSSVECYDSVEDSWHPLQQLPAKLNGVAACSSSDGKFIYCFGGWDSDYKSMTYKIHVYNVFTDTWVDDGVVLSSGRKCATAVRINDRILLFGGYKGGTLSTVEEYLPSKRSLCNRKNMLSSRASCSALPLGDKIYVLGSDLTEGARDFDCYDINKDEWIKIDKLEDDRFAYGAAMLSFKN